MKPKHPQLPQDLLEKNEKRLDSSVNVRYLFAPGELEGGQRRATDPNSSLKVFQLTEQAIVNEREPFFYYLKDSERSELSSGASGPKRGFVREELMIVPRGTELPPV